MKNIAGSEVHVLELAKFFRSQGDNVTVGAFLFGGALMRDLDERGIELLDLNRKNIALLSEWDVIWTHHVRCFYEIHVNRGWRARRFIHGVLSVTVPSELPPFSKYLLLGTPFFSLYANSPATKDFVRERVHPKLDVCVLRNLVGDEWQQFPVRSRGRRLKRVAVVSNHVPQEVFALEQVLKSFNVDVEFFGGEKDRVLISPGVLNPYDAVISIGKTVQYCLAAGIPVFVYDHFGGPGWLASDNIEKAEYYNYNGKCAATKFSPNRLADFLVEGYSEAETFALSKVGWARDRYGISAQLARLSFWKFSDSSCALINDDAARNDVSEALEGSVRMTRRMARQIRWRRRIDRWTKRIKVFMNSP